MIYPPHLYHRRQGKHCIYHTGAYPGHLALSSGRGDPETSAPHKYCELMSATAVEGKRNATVMVNLRNIHDESVAIYRPYNYASGQFSSMGTICAPT